MIAPAHGPHLWHRTWSLWNSIATFEKPISLYRVDRKGDQREPDDTLWAFEADLPSGEVRKSGSRIKLQDQPFKVLQILLEHPGDLVTREELQSRIWPEDSFGDFDHAVNVAVGKLRAALGDSGCKSRPELVRSTREPPSDWGVRYNPRSHRVGLLMFEHQECREFEQTPPPLPTALSHSGLAVSCSKSARCAIAAFSTSPELTSRSE
jgi:hypothetical protein